MSATRSRPPAAVPGPPRPPLTRPSARRRRSPTQVLDAAVRALAASARGRGGHRRHRRLRAGERARPGARRAARRRRDARHGRPGYDGVQAASNPDPFYYRPDNDAPRHPGGSPPPRAASARRDSTCRGIRRSATTTSWSRASGPATDAIEEVATGDRMVTHSTPRSCRRPSTRTRRRRGTRPACGRRGAGPRRDGAADPRGGHLAPAAMVDRLAAAAGVHPAAPDGSTTRSTSAPRCGGSCSTPRAAVAARAAWVTASQVAWLRAQLAATARWIVVFAHNPLEASDGGEAALRLLDARSAGGRGGLRQPPSQHDRGP